MYGEAGLFEHARRSERIAAYELRLTQHANAIIAAYEKSDAFTGKDGMNKLLKQCMAYVENTWEGEPGESVPAGYVAEKCAKYVPPAQGPYAVSGNPISLTNPVYIRVLPHDPTETFKFSVAGFRILDDSESEKAEPWDDPLITTLIMKLNPGEDGGVDACSELIEKFATDKAATNNMAIIGSTSNDKCTLGNFGAYYKDTVKHESWVKLPETFSADVQMRPGEATFISNVVWELDDGEIPKDVMLTWHALTLAVLGSLPKDMSNYGWIAWIIGGVHVTIDMALIVADNLNNPEMLFFDTAAYSREDMVMLTNAAQMGLTVKKVRELQNEPQTKNGAFLENLTVHNFKFDYDDAAGIMGDSSNPGTVIGSVTPFMDGEIADPNSTIKGKFVWGEYNEIRELKSKNPGTSYAATNDQDSAKYHLHIKVEHKRN